MSEALNRVIEEQQKRIDDLLEGNKKLIERSARVFKQNEELFEAMARFWDADLPSDTDIKEGTNKAKQYNHLKWEARMQMIEAGYCVRCYNFMVHCECDE
jgi:hypothetical protein